MTGLDHAQIARLEIPAHPSYLAMIRSVVADMAARTPMGIDIIEDLRIAVDEGVSMLLGPGQAEGTISCEVGIDLTTERISILVAAERAADLPGRDEGDNYTWMLLDAVADTVELSRQGGPGQALFLSRSWALLPVER